MVAYFKMLARLQKFNKPTDGTRCRCSTALATKLGWPWAFFVSICENQLGEIGRRCSRKAQLLTAGTRALNFLRDSPQITPFEWSLFVWVRDGRCAARPANGSILCGRNMGSHENAPADGCCVKKQVRERKEEILFRFKRSFVIVTSKCIN